MRHSTVSRSAYAFVFFLLVALTPAVNAAELVTLIDTDRNPATGCVLHGFAGVDAAVTTEVTSSATGSTISSHRLQLCAAGILGPAVPLGSASASHDGDKVSVEAYVPYAALGIGRTADVRYGFVLLQDGGAAIRVPENGVMLSVAATSRRRSAGPSFQGPPSVVDGNLSDWTPSEQIAQTERMAIWKSAEAEGIFLRFDVRPAAPIAKDDDYSAPFGSTLTIDAPGVLANDVDPEGNPLSAELVSPTVHGTVTLSADGAFVYQHHGSSMATDTFTYRARDPFSASAPATVILTPVLLSHPPVGAGDQYSTAEDQPLVVAAPGVLANDRDPDADALTVQLESAPSQGSVSLQTDGSFTYTPSPNFFGTVTFRYRLSDGTSSSEPIVVTIVIDPVNDAPRFTAGGNITVPEDAASYAAAWASAVSAGTGESQALAFSITNNSNPALFSVAPAISGSGQLTFTVAPNAHGLASLTVILTDDGGTANGGADASAPATFTITVDPLNDAPTFAIPASAPVVDEDASTQTVANFATAISAGPVDENGQTLSFNVTQTSSDATLTFSVAPSIAADGTLSYTAAPNAYGTATLNVVLNDNGSSTAPNANTSVTRTFTITVNPINDAPSFTIANPPASSEDGGGQTVNGLATAISQGPNESGQTLTFVLTSTGTTGTLAFSGGPAIAADGSLTYTAASNTYGTATFDVVLVDNGSGTAPHVNSSAAQSITITVGAINDAPTFAIPTSAPVVDEDASTQTVANFATAISAGPVDESAQTLSFTVTQISSDGTLTFSVAPSIAADGTLSYTAAPNAYGTATFNVVLTDNGSTTAPNANTSVTRTFTITVNPINDAPSFTIANPPASTEDGGAQTVNGLATAISQGPNENGQTLTFVLTSTGTTGTLAFSSGPAIAADGSLTYTAAPNTYGTATFDVVLTDNGSGTAPHANSSAAQSITITVGAINDAPTFAIPTSAPIVDEDASTQTVANFATALSAGPVDENGQTLSFTVTQTSSDATLTFSVAPSIAADGTLSYTAAPNAYGSATFDVVLTDNGASTAPNANTSSTRTFTLTVNPINDAPSFTIANPPASSEDGGGQTVNGLATAISQGPNESGQTLTFVLTSTGTTGTLAFSSGPAIAADGSLTYTAASNTYGTATFDVVLTDNGSGTAPHVNTSAAQSFTITVGAINDAPSFAIPASAPVVDEDASTQTVANFATAVSAGPVDESTQTLSFTVTQISADATLTFSVAPSIAADGTLSYTAAPNAYGTATFNVVLTDNGSSTAPNANTSSTHTFTIIVNPINDAPSFTIANPPASTEDGGAQTVSGLATAISQGPNESGQTLTFVLTSTGTTGTLAFSSGPAIAADGSLTYTAAANTFGTATFNVVLTDNGSGTAPHANSSAAQSITITVGAINDAPTFIIPTAAPVVDEDASAQTVANFATAISAGPVDESAQTLTFSVTQISSDATLTFSVAPSIAADGTLHYTAAPNAYGTATFNVVLTDNGSSTAPNANTSSTHTFTITVNPINDAPSFNVATPPASTEDGGAQTVNGLATAISQGPNESGQTLTFVLTSTGTTGTLAFSSGPAIAADGSLTYTAAANTFGTATLNVVLTDNGSGTAPHVNTSAAQSFTITVDSVNDAPSFSLPTAAPAVNEDAGAQTVAAFATAMSAGPADESGQTLSISVTQTSASPTLTFSAAPSIALDGTLTYTAAPNTYGTATFNVVLTDSGASTAPNVNSSTRTFTITVNPINDAPIAVGDTYSYPNDGSALAVVAPGVLSNDSDIDSASLTAVVVSPPSEGTLALAADGSFTYTKAASPAGTSVTFTYRASDGVDFSNTVTVTINLNTPPVANADAFGFLEDAGYSAQAPGLLANDTDADNNISMLQLVSGPDCAGYAAGTCGNLTLALMQDGSFFYQAPADYNGVVTFTYKLIDAGGLESAPATATLTITPVNDAPYFDPLIVEAQGAQNAGVVTVPYAFNIRRGPVTATDEATQKLHFETEVYLNGHLLKPFADVGAGVASTTGIDIDSTGTLRFSPGSSTGTVYVSVRLVDDGGTDNGGVDASEVLDLTIRITQTFVNKAPSFNVTNLSINEDAAAQSVNNWVTSISQGAGETGQTVTVTVDSYTNPTLFSVPPTIVSNTRLTYTLAPNAVGTSTLTIKAKDNAGTANGGVDELTKTATITVNAVNDAPSFTKGADLVYTAGTTGAQTVSGWATAISKGPSDEATQTLTFAVTVQSGASVFTGTPAIAADGTLSFTLNGTTGLAVLNVRLSDSGGTANGGVNQSAIQSFTINAGGVNTPPSFVKGADVTVLEDSGAATVNGWATSISPGPAADAAQTVSFNVTSTNTTLFSTQPAVSSSGVLTFTPAANQFGSATVSVTAVDNGGTAGGGSNTSAVQTFTITITGVNDAPTLSIPTPAVAGGENGGPRSITGFASAAAGPNETGQTPFTYTVTQTAGSVTLFDTANGGVVPAISATGVLTFTTAVNQNGSATFSVTVRDAGGTANGGVDTSTTQSFTITVGSGGPVVPAAGIAFTAYANIPLTVGTLPGEASYNLLDGASDPDLPLSVQITSKATNARVDVVADGSFTFRNGNLTYNAGAIEPQSFKWRVCDSLGNCSAERTATVSFTGPLVFFSDASAATNPGLYTLDVPGKSIPTGFTTSAAPAATYIIKSGTYSMGTTGATTQLSIRAGDRVYGQGMTGLTLASLGISQASLTVGTLPALPDYSTGTIPTLHMPDPTLNVGGGIVITQSPIFKGYGGGTVKHLRFTRAVDNVASWILFSNASWTSAAGNYVFDDIISVNGQGFAIPQVGSSITVKNSNLTVSGGFGMNGGTITVTNTPIRLSSSDTASAATLFSDFDSNTPGTITATIDAASPITIANNVGHLFPLTISNPSWMPMGTFTINSDITITRTSTTPGLYMKLMSNVTLNGKVTITTATGRPVDISDVSNLTMPHAENSAKMTATPASALNAGITMTNVTAGAAGIKLTNIDVRKGYLLFDNTSGGPITITGGTVVGDLINPCVTTSSATNVTITGVTTSNCGS